MMTINTKLNSALSNQKPSEIQTLTKTSKQTLKKKTKKVDNLFLWLQSNVFIT